MKTWTTYRVEYLAQMVGVRVAYVRAQDLVPAIALEPILDVRCAEAPNRLAGHNTEHHVVPADGVLRLLCVARQQIVAVLVGHSVSNDNAIHLMGGKQSNSAALKKVAINWPKMGKIVREICIN